MIMNMFLIKKLNYKNIITFYHQDITIISASKRLTLKITPYTRSTFSQQSFHWNITYINTVTSAYISLPALTYGNGLTSSISAMFKDCSFYITENNWQLHWNDISIPLSTTGYYYFGPRIISFSSSSYYFYSAYFRLYYINGGSTSAYDLYTSTGRSAVIPTNIYKTANVYLTSI